MRTALIVDDESHMFQKRINREIEEIEERECDTNIGKIQRGHVIDIKCWSDPEPKACLCALILWEMR